MFTMNEGANEKQLNLAAMELSSLHWKHRQHCLALGGAKTIMQLISPQASLARKFLSSYFQDKKKNTTFSLFASVVAPSPNPGSNFFFSTFLQPPLTFILITGSKPRVRNDLFPLNCLGRKPTLSLITLPSSLLFIKMWSLDQQQWHHLRAH